MKYGSLFDGDAPAQAPYLKLVGVNRVDKQSKMSREYRNWSTRVTLQRSSMKDHTIELLIPSIRSLYADPRDDPSAFYRKSIRESICVAIAPTTKGSLIYDYSIVWERNETMRKQSQKH